ncbi:hypothetical protein AN963_12060 [Brevibacillus choshinensis]|uniref:Secreted protein n=1 Tax=Brevibacillus choshinensis TaxID=54911 RepID=A0ABR5N5A2_BRECH|nr:hypothetical protein AN963_12060 [Brevibacillus choshinensis]
MGYRFLRLPLIFAFPFELVLCLPVALRFPFAFFARTFWLLLALLLKATDPRPPPTACCCLVLEKKIIDAYKNIGMIHNKVIELGGVFVFKQALVF